MKLIAAARSAALLSLLFLLVYGGCNWLTSQRGDVGMLYFEWERHIPFVPWMIVPYMSIDLFFLGAPFLCADRAELRVFTRRVVLAILVAGACFLLFPLQFAFERPRAEGWLGLVFDWFRGMDQPFNLLPSLHITLRTILAGVYARHTRGLMRAVCHVWFSLIGLSTLLTYQHHVLDVAGGFVLAACCFHFVPESPARLPVTPNRRVGWYYIVGALGTAALAVLLPPWGLVLLWPALALGLVGGGYFGAGPGIYRKTAGRLPFATRCVLGPVLLGQWLSWLHYRRECRPWDEIVPGVWIGRRLNDREAAEAVRQGVTAVLDLTAEFSEARPFLAVRCEHVPVLDLTAPTAEQLQHMAAVIEAESARGVVYVHCKIGYSRSAAAVGAFLLASGRAATVGEAVSILRQARPTIVVRPEVMNALRELQSFPRLSKTPEEFGRFGDPTGKVGDRESGRRFNGSHRRADDC
jgi:protein-tyrosine phosphatase/membrane-associated phospholipid phosphatase